MLCGIDLSFNITQINMKKIPTFVALSVITLTVLSASCVEIAMLGIMAAGGERGPDTYDKPTLIKLDSSEASMQHVVLNWKGDVPSMDMSGVNSCDGWVTGMKHTANEFRFFQNKYYGLSIDFKKKSFVETGFDGRVLPEVKGSWTMVR